jgi:hypothetical protein
VIVSTLVVSEIYQIDIQQSHDVVFELDDRLLAPQVTITRLPRADVQENPVIG